MKALMDKYLFLIKVYLKEYRVHPVSIFFKLSELPFQMLMYLFLWKYVSMTSQIDFDYMVLYYLLSGLLGLSYPFIHISLDIEKDIMEGGIANCMVRPFHYMMPYVCRYIAWMCIYSIIYIPVLSGLFLLQKVSINSIVFFAACSILGMIVEFMTWFTLGLLALYIERIRGIIRIIAAMKAIISGSLIPLYIMPEFLQNITRCFPFRYYIYVPVNNLLSNAGAAEVFNSMLISTLWIVLLSAISVCLWKIGIMKMQVNVS